MVERGDELYCKDPKGRPFTGKVLAAGEHGCTLRVGGKRQQVPWAHVHGHKVRVQPALSIVDEGEDGFIAKEPRSGVLRYVHDPLGVGEEDMGEPMSKALSALLESHAPAGGRPIDRLLDMRLAAKEDALAKAIKNTPGLSLQDVTDSMGHQTKRWKRTSPKVETKRPARGVDPNSQVGHLDAKAGDHVKWKGGEGKVATFGRKGAHVVDHAGKVHKVTWADMHERNGEKSQRGPLLVLAAKKKADDRQAEQKAHAKAVIDTQPPAPDPLKEDHASHFDRRGAHDFEVSKLHRTKSSEPREVENAEKRMHASSQGKLDKRLGIRVTPNAEGEHVILDGHATHAAAVKNGWKTIPSLVVQPHSDQERVYEGAKEATEHLKDWLNKDHGICTKMGMETQKRAPEDVPAADWEKPGGMLFIAPTKGLERAQEKVAADYDGDWSRLQDAARCTVAVDSIDEVHAMVEKLKASGMVLAKPMKDRYGGDPLPVGYRDVNMIIRAPNGHLTEVQVNTKAMMEAKNEGHKEYEVSRTLEAKHGKKPLAKWPPKDRAAFENAIAEQKRIYGAAYEKLAG